MLHTSQKTMAVVLSRLLTEVATRITLAYVTRVTPYIKWKGFFVVPFRS